MTYLAQAHYFRGEHERVVALTNSNLAGLSSEPIPEDFGLVIPPWITDRCYLILSPASAYFSSWGLALLGEASEALSRLREGVQFLERQAASGYIGDRGWSYLLLGRAALALGRHDDARRLAGGALNSSPHQAGFAAHAMHLLGEVATHPNQFDAESGEAHYRKALAAAEPRGMRPLVAHCHLGLSKLYRRTGKQEQARKHVATASMMYRDMGMTYWLNQTEAR
jgi:tetratricopeptide (TPR) repeat protein